MVDQFSLIEFDKNNKPIINPKDKDAKSQDRVPFHVLPPIAKVLWALAMKEGAYDKGYGVHNWRKFPIEMNIYTDAAERHLTALQDGEWLDRDSKQPHAAKIMACMSIILDAFHEGTLRGEHPAHKDGYRSAAELIHQESHKNV